MWFEGERLKIGIRLSCTAVPVYSVHDPRGGGRWSSSGTRRRPNGTFANTELSSSTVIVFDDDRAITLRYEHPSEERYLTFGTDALDGFWRLRT